MNRTKITNINSINYKGIKAALLKELGIKIVKERRPGLHFKFKDQLGYWQYKNVYGLIDLYVNACVLGGKKVNNLGVAAVAQITTS